MKLHPNNPKLMHQWQSEIASPSIGGTLEAVVGPSGGLLLSFKTRLGRVTFMTSVGALVESVDILRTMVEAESNTPETPPAAAAPVNGEIAEALDPSRGAGGSSDSDPAPHDADMENTDSEYDTGAQT